MAAHIASTAMDGRAFLIGSFTLRCITTAPSISTPRPIAAGCATRWIQMAAMSATAMLTFSTPTTHINHAHQPKRQPVGGGFLAQILGVAAAKRRRLVRAEHPDVQDPEGNTPLQGGGVEIFHGLKVTTSGTA